MSGPEASFLKRVISAVNSNLSNLKNSQLQSKLEPALKVGKNGSSQVAKKLETYREKIAPNIKSAITKYEKITGVQELLTLQKRVVAAQEKFVASQDKRRQAGAMLAELQQKIHDLHADMQNTSKADERYLQLITEEHKALVHERNHRQLFENFEKEERELFAEMSSAVKLSHEQERAHAERSKYWAIVASIVGTVLGIAGSTINNHLKMNEFKQMMNDQMNRSMGMMVTAVGGDNAARNFNLLKSQSSDNVQQLEKSMSNKLEELDNKINGLSGKYNIVFDTMRSQDQMLRKNFIELRQLFLTAFQSSEKSDAKLAKMMKDVVSHDDRPFDILYPQQTDINQHEHQQNVARSLFGLTVISFVCGYALSKLI